MPGATTYLWDFGDGTTSALQHPAHTYTEEGVYSVTLTVAGAAGAVTKHKKSFINTSQVTESLIEAFAAGETGEEQMELQIDGVPVATWIVGGNPGERQLETFVYQHDRFVSPNQVRVVFSNDGMTATGLDRNLTVDRIRINGATYESENASVYAVGVFNGVNGCGAGFLHQETLSCNGYFQYAPPLFPGTFAFGAPHFTLDEGEASVILPVVRTGGSDGTVSVAYAAADGTAVEGFDYVASSGILTFDTGQTSGQIVIPLVDDKGLEGAEYFRVALSQPGGGALLGQPQLATVFLQDNEPLTGALIEVLAAGETGEELLELQIDGIPVAVWTVGGDPTGREFETFAYRRHLPVLAGQVIVAFINDGATSTGGDRNLTVDRMRIDGVVFQTEAPEVYSVGSFLTANGCGEGFVQWETLVCNGYFQYATPFNPGTISLGTPLLNVSEGAGTVTIPVVRTGGSDGLVSVSFATTSGSALADVDFTSTSGMATFNPGETTGAIVVPLFDDALVEPTENFSVTLSQPIGGATLGAPHVAVVHILDNEPSTSLIEISAAGDTGTERMELRINEVQVAEWSVGGNPSARQFERFVYTHSVPVTPDQLRVAFINDGSTASGGDRNLTVDRIRVNGMTYETEAPSVFSIGSFDATNFCGPGFQQHETLFCNGYFQYAPCSNRGTIALAVDAMSVSEGAGTATIPVVRTGGSDGIVSVSFATASGTAVAGADFASTTGVITFLSGETSSAIVVPLIDDALPEGVEAFGVVLSQPVGGALLGEPQSVTVALLDNDGLPGSYIEVLAAGDTGEEQIELQISGITAASWIVRGNPAARQFESFVYLHPAPVAPNQVRVAFVNDGLSAAGRDRNVTVDRIRIDGADYQTEAPTVFAIDSFDAASFCAPGFQQHETLFCHGFFQYAPTFNQGTIALGAASVNVVEGAPAVTISVVRSGGSDGVVSVSYATASGTAIAGSDFASTSGVLTFQPGETIAPSSCRGSTMRWSKGPKVSASR